MSLDPPLQRIVDLLRTARPEAPPVDDHEARREANRRTFLGLGLPSQPTVKVSEEQVEVSGGSITVRVHHPATATGSSPAYVHLHGGGWFQGDLDVAEVEVGPVASDVDAVVIFVDYRLAPEHPFPTPVEDCIAAYRWVHEHAERLGIDTARVAVGGGSAGANLAAALCIAARDRGLSMPVLQLLEVPAMDLTLTSPSLRDPACASGFGVTGDEVDELVAMYVPDPDQRTNPLVSPLFGDLHGLPPAVIITGELDPVRDDGERYLAALHAAGVPATCFRILAQPHGGWIVPVSVASGMVRDVKLSALRRAFAGNLVPSFGE